MAWLHNLVTGSNTLRITVPLSLVAHVLHSAQHSQNYITTDIHDILQVGLYANHWMDHQFLVYSLVSKGPGSILTTATNL
jgi:hypothetical protein